MPSNASYVYAYLRANGTPYYIGKGTGYRAFDNRSRCVSTPKKERILFLKENLSHQEAFDVEKSLIQLIGRKDLNTGPLRNTSAGGDGNDKREKKLPSNPYLTQTGPQSEKYLYNELWQEAISLFGQNYYYIPRDTVLEDDLFGEDRASNFKNAYPMAMMVENIEGYDGEDLFQRFGVELKESATLVVSKKEFFDELVSTPHSSLVRPREGDLIFVPFSDSLFEITFVEHEQPFYIWNELPAYKFSVELFRYNNEDIDVDVVGLDKPAPDQTAGQGLEAKGALLKLVLASGGAFQLGENITQTYADGTIVTGEIAKIENAGATIYVAHISHDDTSDDYNIFVSGRDIVSVTSALTRSVTTVTETHFDYAKNDEIETEADTIIDFTESNPFGEV